MDKHTVSGISRRSFVLGSGLVTGGVAVTALPLANADEPVQEAESSETADVLIIGSGLAGLVAAIRVLENGATPLLIDKADGIGSFTNSALSGGALAKPNDDSEESIQAFIDVLNTKSQGKGDAAITELIARNISSGLEWLQAQGAQLNDPAPHTPFDCLKIYVSPGASQGMPALMETLAKKYADEGGASLTNTKLIDLLYGEDGRISGARVKTSDGFVNLKAKTTIVATGGYVANKQLLEMYVGPEADEIMLRGHATTTGDGILACERAGAMLRQMGGDASLHVGAVSPDNIASGNPSNALGYCLAVNSEGNRYADESKGYVNHGKALMNQPGQTCALIFDSVIAEQEKVQQDIERFASFGSAPIEAETLEQLAELISVPADALINTVSEFNEHVTADGTTEGLAVDKTAMAMKVETGPFYAFYPLRPGSIMAFGGVYANANMEVLEPDGDVIPCLFVAGEAVGGVFMYDYLAGTSLDRCIVTGLVAADNACALL